MYGQILKEILLKFEKKRDRNLDRQRRRTREVYEKIPKTKEIDEKIASIGIEMSRAVIENPDNFKEKMVLAKGKMEKLQMEKAFLLTENNIDLNYLELKYDCERCKDTGYLDDGRQCYCLVQELIDEAYEMSNIKTVLEKENFETFRVDIVPDTKYEDEDMTPRENIKYISNICVDYVNNFNENNDENLLFYGNTGLGKTFMCNCIAKALLDMNKIVVYQTAFKILEIIEKRRFDKSEDRFKDYQYQLLFDADLLIIDDLGTELSNAFTNAEIFNIVNTRLISGKKTIISTNLSPKELSQIYSDRIFSRVFEKFIPLRFFGPDLRYYQWDVDGE